jgi:short-subunit dehydrogenase
MHVLILGANSDVAHALAKKLACTDNANLYLASRDLELLDLKARDVHVRCGVQALALPFDATDYASHDDFYERLDPKPDGVVLAFGYNGVQQKAQEDFTEACRIIDINFRGAVSILEIVAADFEKRRAGFIVAIGSVAGLRGRRSNYIYGSAKAALQIYLDGLRSRLCQSDVQVLTVLPGFMDTKMTAGMALPKVLTATAEQAADDIYAALKKRRHRVYTRWFWRWIMLIIRAVPEPIFKRLSL